MKKMYETLIADFCALTGVVDPTQIAALINGNAVEIDGVDFSLAYSETEAPDRLMIFCDYGAIPQGEELEVYRALLEANLFTYSSDSAVFATIPGSNHVLCAHRFALNGLNAEALRGIVGFISERARDWRHTHFDPAAPSLNGRSAPQSSAMAKNLTSQMVSTAAKKGTNASQ